MIRSDLAVFVWNLVTLKFNPHLGVSWAFINLTHLVVGIGTMTSLTIRVTGILRKLRHKSGHSAGYQVFVEDLVANVDLKNNFKLNIG